MIEILHQETGQVLLSLNVDTLAGYKFKGRLVWADLSNHMLPGVDFTLGNLSHVNFSESMMEEAVFFNAVLSMVHFEKSELAQADFSEAVIMGGVFRDCDLQNAHFRYAKMTDVEFVNAKLRNADFSMCVLSGSCRGADLTGADFRGADLRDVDFTGAKLDGVKLQNAKFRGKAALSSTSELLKQTPGQGVATKPPAASNKSATPARPWWKLWS
jgi:uncharacterized protein YjbI with pentapeptide repeats